MAKNKTKKKVHVTYNKKTFLAPDCITSMAAIHTKIYEDGTAIIRISDCLGSIKLWNNLNVQHEVNDMLDKIDTTVIMLKEFRKEVEIKLNKI